ncbi:DUF2750 domain-containing protein [Aquisalimonas asiatica]|uniref:DUF2750 domain-containing protein n=1 Tax=Aquisalimonas asiatica TaxID=406100 RepID=A0A1H8Q7J3_9GAMM|nr:DUF2750 domain-containing protein [Aquisalimonas asiatica]SEO50205.1 Protein of unknown function [Aquisalimonas asiatica]
MTDIGDQPLDASYEAFLEAVVDSGLVWGLCDDEGWAMVPSADDDEAMVMPFWSSEGGATACASGEWDGFVAEPLPLEDFMEQWLPGMEGDGHRAGVDWSADLDGVEVPPLELQADLEATLVGRDDEDE